MRTMGRAFGGLGGFMLLLGVGLVVGAFFQGGRPRWPST
ncbi:hypothetical protein Mhypo_00147 [Meiothermus hypogaeus]|uniref:Uncharacterized protein n=1 Tax=Meiothermus hypogaeus TaxID=884155 RepID=A0ABX9MTM1_9DEIN|nr:hypothetical protein Mhypo_00147 [Meiothermus hypogaeus]